MSDIHQEWRELREKNGNFINHLDGEVAKIEKKQVELKRREQMQDMTDAGAFAMHFVAPPPFNCCQDDRDILKALNKAQADRIEHLEDEITAYKKQQDVDLAIKKDLDEKLDKATADYLALLVERDNLMDTISRMEKTIRDLDERNGTLRERLSNTNASLKRSIQENSKLQSDAAYLRTIRANQANEIERLQSIVNAPNGSCSAYTQQGMQSKIAKQAAEIKRLTEMNERLSGANDELSGRYEAQKVNTSYARGEIKRLTDENKQLHNALDIAAKDADANFERGKIKGMEEIWDELKDCYDGRPLGENQKIFGYHTVGEIVDNLSPTWFINRAEEYHEQEKKEARDIKIGDEIEIFDQFCPDDDPHSDIGIVIAIDKDHPCFAVIGPKFEGCFDETDIDAGIAKKTGRHFDTIPLDYLA